MQSWSIQAGGEPHDIEFEGLSATGKAKLLIDGVEAAVAPVFMKNQGYFFRYFIGESEIILRMERKNDPAQLAVDGIYYGSDQPVESDILFSLRSQANAGHPLGKQNREGMGAFLTFVIATYVNMGLYFIGEAPLFPFSLYFPYWLIARFENVAKANMDNAIFIIGIVVALICATINLLLYALGKRRSGPLGVALLLVVLDALLIAWEIFHPIRTSIAAGWLVVYLLFHLWVAGTLLSVLRVRGRMKREKLDVAEIG